jgi:hypothetical protein
MRYWDINEVMTANEWLDIQDDREWLHSMEEKAKAEAAGRK